MDDKLFTVNLINTRMKSLCLQYMDENIPSPLSNHISYIIVHLSKMVAAIKYII